MKIKLTYLLVFLSLWSCRKITSETDEILPVVKFIDNVVLTGVDYVSKNGNKLYFDMNVVSLKNGTSHFDFPDTAFHNYYQTNPELAIEIQSVERNLVQQDASYDVILLLDLSQPQFASWIGPSIYNEISRLIRICNQSDNKRIAIGYYARNVLDGEPVLFCSNPATGSIFDNSNEQLIDFLTKNFEKVGEYEYSSMLDAIDISVEKLVELSGESAKSIVLLNGNDDDGQSLLSHSQLIQKCKNNNVSVSYLNWGQNYCNYVELALETKGFYGVANSIGEFTTVVYCLHELLAKNYHSYKLSCMASKPQTWFPNNTICAPLDVRYYKEVDSPYFDEDLYNDFEVNNFVPLFLRVP
jgi:hypothetical protein